MSRFLPSHLLEERSADWVHPRQPRGEPLACGLAAFFRTSHSLRELTSGGAVHEGLPQVSGNRPLRHRNTKFGHSAQQPTQVFGLLRRQPKPGFSEGFRAIWPALGRPGERRLSLQFSEGCTPEPVADSRSRADPTRRTGPHAGGKDIEGAPVRHAPF